MRLACCLQAISRAFEVLADEQQRRKYDRTRFGTAGSSRRGPGSAGGGAGAGGAASRRGGYNSNGGEPLPPDVRAVLQLDFREAALGVERAVTLQLQDVCQQCSGTGGQPGTLAPPCCMCKGRREIVKLHSVGGTPGAKAAGKPASQPSQH